MSVAALAHRAVPDGVGAAWTSGARVAAAEGWRLVMTEEQIPQEREVVADRAVQARWRSQMLRAEIAKLAEQVAATEEAVAETLARMASQHPHRRSRLLGLSQAASNHAALERRQAVELAEPQRQAS